MLRDSLTLNKASGGSCSEDVAFKVWLWWWGRASLVTGGWASSAKNSRASWEALSWAVKAPGDGEADSIIGQQPVQCWLERGLGHGQEHWVFHNYLNSSSRGSKAASGLYGHQWHTCKKQFFYYLYSEIGGLSTEVYRPWHHIGVVRKFSSLIFNTVAIVVLVLRSHVYPG